MRNQSNAVRKVIAVDLDEVLARTSLAIAEFHNDTYGTSLTMQDFISYDYTKIWGGTREESITKWRLFFDSPYFLKVEPVEGSLETLKLLKSRRFSLVIVTARQQFVAELTKKFVDRHFPGIFESIYFANHYLTEQEKLNFISKPKSIICRDVHAQLLIDDSLEIATEVAKAGIPVLLFDHQGSYKWNKLKDGEKLPDKVTRVKSWKEIQDWFPRPRSPLSTLCISRDDQISDESDEEDEDEELDDGTATTAVDSHSHFGFHHHQQLDDMDSESESDDDIDVEEDELNELTKREQDEDEHHGRTLRRRKLMMMDFSSSEDDDDIDFDQSENMDGDEQDFDLESGHASRHITHEDLERYRHENGNMYSNQEEDSMEMEVETETDNTSVSSESTFVQASDDMELGLSKATSSIVSITAAQVECESSNGLIAIPTSPDAMAVEGLTIKSPPTLESPILQANRPNMEMENVPLS
ncbi:hypothetical protein BGZ76_000523 [Entomortierella beljakovae]|nr:hypothetical protein BGZ76_000523 [Entomortierella beljakovae]